MTCFYDDRNTSEVDLNALAMKKGPDAIRGLSLVLIGG